MGGPPAPNLCGQRGNGAKRGPASGKKANRPWSNRARRLHRQVGTFAMTPPTRGLSRRNPAADGRSLRRQRVHQQPVTPGGRLEAVLMVSGSQFPRDGTASKKRATGWRSSANGSPFAIRAATSASFSCFPTEGAGRRCIEIQRVPRSGYRSAPPASAFSGRAGPALGQGGRRLRIEALARPGVV